MSVDLDALYLKYFRGGAREDFKPQHRHWSANLGVSRDIVNYLWEHYFYVFKHAWHLFLVLHFLKCYPTFDVMAAKFKRTGSYLTKILWKTLIAFSLEIDEVRRMIVKVTPV